MKVNLRRLIGMLGLVYVGLFIFFTPSMSDLVAIRVGTEALERIKENTEFREDAEKVEHQLEIISNQREMNQQSSMIILMVIFTLSLFLTTLKDKSDPVGGDQ